MKNTIVLLATIFSFFSCEKNEETIVDTNNLLIGNWSRVSYQNEETTFSRAQTLSKDAYGISFIKKEDVFKERTSGWCGTPPLTFFNIDGNWELDNGLIKISTQQYLNNYHWRIISLDEENLVVKRELTAQEKEHQQLMILFDEISTLSYSVSCANSNNWTFTSYGAKACGGSKGYIAYANQIDTVSFLQKIEKYSKAEKEYNVKWGIISDCSTPNEPKSITCKNGFPTLNY